MAYDAGLAEAMREALGDMPGLSEKRMFGGICFLVRGNMLCGVLGGGGMARVGKANEAAALACEGVAPLALAGRRMGGLVELTGEVVADPARLAPLLDLCFDFVGPMPPK